MIDNDIIYILHFYKITIVQLQYICMYINLLCTHKFSYGIPYTYYHYTTVYFANQN